MTRERLADRPSVRLSARAFERRARERVAVHRGIVVRRHVDRRNHVFGQHAIERVAEATRSTGAVTGRGPLANDLLRRADGQRVRIVLGDAAGKVLDVVMNREGRD